MTVAEIIGRRSQSGRWVFVLASVPPVLFALVGIAYGAFHIYAPIAAVFLVEAAYPTLLGWLAVLVACWGAFLAYAFHALSDVVHIVAGEQPSVFLGGTATSEYLVLLAVVGAIAVGVTWYRPGKLVIHEEADA